MAKSLDFNKIEKRYLTITLADDNHTTVMIGTPNKKVMSELILLQDSLDSMEDEGADVEKMDCLYSLCSRLMSRNKGGIMISKETIEDLFDFEDIVIFFNAYMNFIDEVMKTKN